MATFVGIDLGTTNSVVACRNAYGRPEVIPNREGQNVTPDKGIVRAMLKDLHLIEAALVSDQTVLSLDETVRRHFSNTAILVDDLKVVIWVNPVLKRERAIAWLKDGAKPDASRLLGFRKK